MDVQLIAFIGVAAGMVALPGADFTVVVRNALASRSAGVASALGVAGGCWCTPPWPSQGSPRCWWRCPRSCVPSSCSAGPTSCTSASAPCARPGAAPRTGTGPRSGADQGRVRALRQGFLTNALNPKAPVLFLSLLPQFVPDGQPPLPRTLLLAAIVVAMALVWFPVVALLVDRLGRWLRRPRTARAIEGGSGAALTALGLVLVTGPLPH